ncbi:MAG: hypothetical protein C0501_29175 [Isosphaera sp.]|nr:hypothetical protein [Isosphaera sp.]
MPLLRRTLLATALAGLALSASRADDLTTAGGKKIVGKLQAVDGLGVTFAAGGTTVTVPAKDIVVVDLGNKVAPLPPAGAVDKDGKPVRTIEVELTDGSTFRVKQVAVKARKLEADLSTVPEGVTAPALDLPLSAVFSVMRGAEDPKNRDGWKKVLASRGKRDLYVTRTPTGYDYTQGTVLGGAADGVNLDFEKEDGTKTQLLLSRATGGLVFAHQAPAQVPQTLCKVADVFGNVLVAQAVVLTAEGVTVTTVSGVVVKYPSAAAVARLDYGQANVAYLSDLDPAVDAPPVPADERGLRVNVLAPFTRDRGVAGEPLKFGAETFPKGIVVAPDTALTFALGGDYREFKAVVGVPENSPDADLGARLTIEADGNRVYSEALKRKDGPKPVTLDVKGAKQLRVIVEADLPVNGNRVVLADARVQK